MSETPKEDADWSEAHPRLIPVSSAWPAGMAFGITLLIWGLVTSIVLVLVGLTVMVVSLGGWIGEMRDE